MSIYRVSVYNRSTKIESKKNKYFSNFSDAAEEAEDISFNKFYNLKTSRNIDVLICQYLPDGNKVIVGHCPASASPAVEMFSNPIAHNTI